MRNEGTEGCLPRHMLARHAPNDIHARLRRSPSGYLAIHPFVRLGIEEGPSNSKGRKYTEELRLARVADDKRDTGHDHSLETKRSSQLSSRSCVDRPTLEDRPISRDPLRRIQLPEPPRRPQRLSRRRDNEVISEEIAILGYYLANHACSRSMISSAYGYKDQGFS